MLKWTKNGNELQVFLQKHFAHDVFTCLQSCNGALCMSWCHMHGLKQSTRHLITTNTWSCAVADKTALNQYALQTSLSALDDIYLPCSDFDTGLGLRLWICTYVVLYWISQTHTLQAHTHRHRHRIAPAWNRNTRACRLVPFVWVSACNLSLFTCCAKTSTSVSMAIDEPLFKYN